MLREPGGSEANWLPIGCRTSWRCDTTTGHAAGITGWLVSAAGAVEAVELRLGDLTADERQIILDGCLINFYNHN